MSGTYPIAAVGGDIYTTASPSIALSSPESCTDSGDHTTYQAATHEFWDWTQTLTVQNSPNGSSSWSTVTDYVFQWATGRVVFNTARTPGTNAFTRISAGNFLTATQADSSYMWSADIEGKIQDTTVFQSPGGWQLNTGLTKSAKGQFETYRNDNRYFLELGNLVGIKLYIDKPNNVRWQCFAVFLQAPNATAKVSAVETQKISFVSVQDVYFVAS
jgi:hypothetical protein